MHILEDRIKAAPLFENYKWNYIAAGILEGFHGEVLVDDLKSPNVAALRLPEINLMIVGGDPAHPSAYEFISGLNKRAFLVFADHHEVWSVLGKAEHGIKFFEVDRYAFTSEGLDLAHLQSLREGLPEGFSLKLIDRPLAEKIKSMRGELVEDHLSNFASIDDFLKNGFGFAILEGEKIVSLASSFLVCDAGIEIQINTDRKYEGRGLGTVVGAALILESLERGLDPNWDAASPTSAHLAKKFGYTEQGEYQMVILFGSKLLVGFLLGLKRVVGLFRRKDKE